MSSTKVSSKAKNRRVENRNGVESHSGCDNGKSAYAYVGCVAQHEGVTEGKGRDD